MALMSADHAEAGAAAVAWRHDRDARHDSRKAAELALSVICAAGRDLDNLRRILEGESFAGTTIGPG